MKALIIALNSKYIHSSLALWYLKASCRDVDADVKIKEFTINDSLDSILAEIYLEKADIAAFSCYIWNIEHVLKLVEALKKIVPGIKIVLGGPEVSFDTSELMNSNSYIDFVISGEGEYSFPLLLEHFMGKRDLHGIGGLWYRSENSVKANETWDVTENLDRIPSPYTDEMIASLGNRIAYYESSRGCPFSCAYCLSSNSQGVRYFSMERVGKELKRLMSSGVKQIKFVDRTFNCSRERAKEIFKFIIDNAGDINFHFEAAADLFDDEMLEILSGAPPGLIQLEIGVQTTNLETLNLINRKTSLEKVFSNVKRLRSYGSIHLHLDLIAGLPGEDYSSFKKSFDDVYGLRPHQLQLGFLKMLKGSKVREEAGVHGYEFRFYPPYEILTNKYISFEELQELKGIEELVERYYNSGKFIKALEFIISTLYASPFEFYRDFYKYNYKSGYLDRPLAARELYGILQQFTEIGERDQNFKGVLNDLLKFDFLCADNTNNLPKGISRKLQESFRDRCFDFLKSEINIREYLPGFVDMTAKQIHKYVHFEAFDYDIIDGFIDSGVISDEIVILFDYSQRNKATGLYNYIKLGKGCF